MKRYSRLFFLPAWIALILLGAGCSVSRSPETFTKGEIESMLINRDFTFVADRVNPLRGSTRVLTSRYDVRVSSDSLISFLPYFGRAYVPPTQPGKVLTQFTSVSFSYEVDQRKNGRWNVLIRPADVQDIQELLFTIFENGNASLGITSRANDHITYDGYLIKNNDTADR